MERLKEASGAPSDSQARARILAFVPNWVGDAVMATPAFHAVRLAFPSARIVAVARPYVAEVLSGIEDVDEVRGLSSLKSGASLSLLRRDARAAREEGYDLAILFTNSFRTAAFAWMAGARRRLGYAREWRGIFLTDRLRPLKVGGKYAAQPMVDYYMALAEAASVIVAPRGAEAARPASVPDDGPAVSRSWKVPDRAMRLAVTSAESAAAAKVLAAYNVAANARLAVLNPGAAFGSAKCWPAGNFAAVADALSSRGFEVLVVTAPKEKDIAEAIAKAASRALKPVWRADVPLGTLKALISRAALLITNDSGPRHFGAALGVPVVTLIGPTDPRWSDTGYLREVVLNERVECAPCMLRTCPRDHRCMTGITPDKVLAAIDALLS